MTLNLSVYSPCWKAASLFNRGIGRMADVGSWVFIAILTITLIIFSIKFLSNPEAASIQLLAFAIGLYADFVLIFSSIFPNKGVNTNA